MRNHQHHNKAIPIAHYGHINTNYDPDEPLSKPKKEAWRERARCRNVHANDVAPVFFPREHHFGPPPLLDEDDIIYDKARSYCRLCPVKSECLEAAVSEERSEPNGYRGDKTEYERKEIFKARLRAGQIGEDMRYRLNDLRHLLGTRDNHSEGNQE